MRPDGEGESGLDGLLSPLGHEQSPRRAELVHEVLVGEFLDLLLHVELAIRGDGDHEDPVIDQEDVRVVAIMLDLGLIEVDADDLGVQVEVELGLLGPDHEVVVVCPGP